MYLFSYEYLDKLAEENRSKFNSGKPFPNLVIDNFLPNDEAKKIAEEFPNAKEDFWIKHGSGSKSDNNNDPGTKIASFNEKFFPPNIRQIMTQFNSQAFLKFLQEVCEINFITGDAFYNECGLHSTGRGGRLMIHADQNRYQYPDLMHQFINVIYYATPNWDRNWGGSLELWNKELSKCEKKIDSIFNRLVIFETGRYSYHGHPDPLMCPENIRRNSLALYYYVPQRELGKNYTGFVKNVIWQKTNKEDNKLNRNFIINIFKKVIFYLTPPIFAWITRKLSIKRKM